MKHNIWEEAVAFFFKILLPPIVGISIKVAIKMEREKMTMKRIIIAFIVGVGVTWLCSPVILYTVSPTYSPMILAVVAITGDKIAEYFMYKFNVDGFISAFIANLVKSNKKE